MIHRVLRLPLVLLCLAPALLAQTPALAPPIALPLPEAPGGHILFTRGVPITLEGGGMRATVPVPKLFSMRADGSEVRPFFATGDAVWAKEARWCANYGLLCFSSDWQEGRSCCVQDVFVAAADGSATARITGAEPRGPSPAGYGAVTGVIRDNTRADEDYHLEKPSVLIHITAQGADGLVVHPGDPFDAQMVDADTRAKLGKERWRRFYIPKVAAGSQVWIKIWASKHMGHLVFAPVKAGVVNDIGEVELNIGNYYAGNGAVTPDGKYLVGMGGIASVATKAESPVLDADGRPIGGTSSALGGTQTLCVWDAATGAILWSWDSSRAGFQQIKDPALSPDGRWIAMGIGEFSLESLAVAELAGLLAGRPQIRPLVQGQRVLPSEATMGKAGHVSCVSPAWSPDGRQIVFSRARLGEVLAGDLWIVNADGSGLRQITNLGPQAMAAQACFSPDGRHLAFTLVTGKQGFIRLEQFLTLNVNVNLCRLDLATGSIVALTNDNVSAEPAWGRW